MGIIDYFRIPKRAWYWYRNAYKGITPPEWPQEGTPARISLVADRTDNIKADGTDDVMLSITILDAAESRSAILRQLSSTSIRPGRVSHRNLDTV